MTASQATSAIFVLGTPVRADAEGRVLRAIAHFRDDPNNILVVLGNKKEAEYMTSVALGLGHFDSRLIVDESSKTTVDNAFYAKRICSQYNIRSGIIVTSQYQMSRAVTTFEWVFGRDYLFQQSASLSTTGTMSRLRETLFRLGVPLFMFFRRGDAERLKRASDKLWGLFKGPSLTC